MWYELKFLCPESLVDPVSGLLWEKECQGITEGKTLPEGVPLQVSFENTGTQFQTDTESSLKEFFALCDKKAPIFSWSQVKEENWKETHRRFYPAQPLSGRFYLVPAWERETLKVPAGFHPIVLEPGRAFGTGLHPSTRLALWLLEEYLEKNPHKKVLDVGTGSGILAIAARMLGADVKATDNDPEAVEVAKENADFNQISGVEFSESPLESFQQKSFDLIVANILLRTHEALLDSYMRLLAPGGVLVLSGLLVDQRQSLEPRLKNAGYQRNRSKVSDEWEAVAYVGS